MEKRGLAGIALERASARILYAGVIFPSKIKFERGKRPHPQDFSLTKKTARFTKGQFRPY